MFRAWNVVYDPTIIVQDTMHTPIQLRIVIDAFARGGIVVVPLVVVVSIECVALIRARELLV